MFTTGLYHGIDAGYVDEGATGEAGATRQSIAMEGRTTGRSISSLGKRRRVKFDLLAKKFRVNGLRLRTWLLDCQQA
jgi:hypothetical protein